ncbi:intraflagellar transport protein 56-like [Halichondria panicea]|uniref:intraflagellar transport protein 56-like n=1 Tax=Halichondria panicea TaxID=6063 RepID=UPI00312B867C
MILSRSKPASGQGGAAGTAAQAAKEKKKKKLPKLDDFVKNRDYAGAITLLEFIRSTGKSGEDSDQWMAYCSFHSGDYQRAKEEYEKLTRSEGCNPDTWCNLACCLFMLGMYSNADSASSRGSKGRLQNRLQFHLSHKFGDEKRLMSHHQELKNMIEDQLSLAAIHYLRTHYQEAIDIYKKILLDNREMLALNVYLAMCYHKLDYYDVSQEVLAGYVQQHPDSVVAINLKACNFFKLYNGKAAEAELKVLMDMASTSLTFAKDLLRHNLVIFRGGEGALQVLPQLLGVIPEARLNLAIYHLKQDNVEDAYALIKDLEPSSPHEYILKAVANTVIGQEHGTHENIKLAQQYFQLVGGSGSECDTIPGRQCMASCFFLLRQFDDVLLYLNSVKGYFFNLDSFNFNFAQAKAATGNYKEAEEVFLLINSEALKNDYVYIGWLARCYIMNRKPQAAWELYLKMETSADSFNLLQLIANDCYKMGQFYFAARAFDVLERLDPNPDYWEGKRGACVGLLQLVIAGHEPKESLKEIVQILRNTPQPQAELIVLAIRKWARDNRVPIPG